MHNKKNNEKIDRVKLMFLCLRIPLHTILIYVCVFSASTDFLLDRE